MNDLILSGLEVAHVDSNYIKFLTGDYFGLSLTTNSDTACDAGLTLTPNSFNECTWDGGNASAITLPSAKKGTLVVVRYTDDADGGADMTFTTASGDFYAKQSLNTDVTNIGDDAYTRRLFGTDFTQTVATYGGAIVAVTAAHNTFTIAATATNNQTGKGAEISFYCQEDGFWRIAFLASEMGSGALNGTFAGSTV